MVNRYITLGILVMASLVPLNGHAQGCGDTGDPFGATGHKSGFSMDNESGSVTIPFVMYRNHLVLAVEVEGNIFDVILDTGMPTDGLILFGSDRTKSLNLEYTEQIYCAGSAGGEPTPAALAAGYDVKLSGLTLTDQTIMVMSPDAIRSLTFEDEAGVIGASVFNQFVVHIDYETSQLTLTDPKKYSYSGNASVIPLIGAGRGAPRIDLTVTLSDGTTLDREVVLDLGASHALVLNTAPQHKVPLPERSVRRHIGTGIDGKIFGHVGRIKSLSLGPHTFSEVVVSFSDRASASCGPNSHGNLGQEILKRFDLTIDYSGDRMILLPNSNYVNPFTFDMTGASLERTASGNYRVFELVPDSPATEVGMEINDIVTKINGTSAADIDRDNLTSLLRGKSGMTLVVEIDRPHETVEMKMHLREII